MSKKRCEFCHKWFLPSPYAAHHQKCCSNTTCRKKRKAKANKNWREKNPDYERSRNIKRCIWAKTYPNYWRRYRKEHPDYARKERRRMRSARKKAKSVAKQDTARQSSLEKLENIRDFGLNSVAKQDAVFSQINGILDYLSWKECVAKQDIMENQLCNTV